MREFKGQKTLSMIVSMSLISLAILIVLNVVQDSQETFGESQVMDTELRSIETTCSRKCGRLQVGEQKLKDAVDYCTERFEVDERGKKLGSGYNSYCSDGVRCFNVNSCEYKSRALNAAYCKDLMCNYFNKSDSTGERVLEYFEKNKAQGELGAGTCDLENSEDSANYEITNWWKENFDKSVSNVCK